MSRVYLVARDRQQAKFWADEWKLEDWRYVVDDKSLYGVHNADVRIVGTPEERKDWTHIWREVNRIRMENLSSGTPNEK